MPGSPTGPRAAYIEDYNEDAKTTLPETRQTANVGTRRSKPDIAKGNTVNVAHDEFSDSGYSSRTGATLGSGDSSLDSRAGAAPLRINTDTAAGKAGSSGSHHKEYHGTQTVKKPILRRTDPKAKERGSKSQQECRCDDCSPKEHQTTKSPEKSRSSRDATTRTMPKNPPPIAVPPRPQSTKPLPPKPAQEVPTLQPAQVRPRAATSQSYRKQRPMSFHGGSLPPQVTYQPIYVAQTQPTMTAAPQMPPLSYPPPSQSYFAPNVPIQHSPYAYSTPPSPLERRPPTRWINPDPMAQQRQSIMYSSSPIIEHAQQPLYTTSVQPQPIVRRTSVQRGYPHHPREEQHYVRDEDYYKMPPPPPPPKPQSARPTIRHAATTSAAHAALYQRRAEADQEAHPPLRSPIKATTPIRETSRRPSVTTRPSASSNHSSGSSSHDIERDMRRFSIESGVSARNGRPLSYYGHESPHELERSVEAYQASTGTGTSVPLTADSLNHVRRKTHTVSESGSRLSTQSKGSKKSSEGKARRSTDRRGGSDVRSHDEQDGLTLSFNASQGVNVDFKGASVEGRTISLRQGNDGPGNNMVLGIGGKSGTTSSRASLKSRKQYSYVESTGVRELEPAGSTSRSTRESKTRESSRAPEKRVAVSRSRRSSKSGRN